LAGNLFSWMGSLRAKALAQKVQAILEKVSTHIHALISRCDLHKGVNLAKLLYLRPVFTSSGVIEGPCII
jgi:hypothetical protein